MHLLYNALESDLQLPPVSSNQIKTLFRT